MLSLWLGHFSALWGRRVGPLWHGQGCRRRTLRGGDGGWSASNKEGMRWSAQDEPYGSMGRCAPLGARLVGFAFNH